MTTAIKRRRGTTSQHSTFTGLEGEITIDTTKDTVVVHDGSTAGGFPLAKENNPTFTGTATIPTVDINGGTIDGAVIGGASAAAGTFTSATVGSTASSAAVHSYTKLEVESSSHTALQLSGSTGGEQWIWFADDSSSTPVGGITYYHGGPYMGFRVEGSERLRIDSSGNVGIGDTAPVTPLTIATTNKLGSTFTGTTNGEGLTVTQTNYTAGNYISLVEAAYDDSNDANPNVRIGAMFDGNGSNLAFGTSNGYGSGITNTAMFINSSGNVGIGTSSPDKALTISASDSQVRLYDADGTNQFASFQSDGGTTKITSRNNTSHGTIAFQRYNGTTVAESMRIDSSGNVLVGKTTTDIGTAGSRLISNGQIQATASGQEPYFANRLSSDGVLFDFRKDGATAGGISVIGTEIAIHSSSGTSGIRFNANGTLPTNGSGSVTDNTYDLGQSGVRWDDIFATNGTIQTSDRNEKQDIEALLEAEQRVAVAAKGLLRKFRWKDSVEEKGDDARIHFGIIAQDLQAAFEAEGLDAGRYAMFINSTWTDEETGEERSRMGVRYNQLLAFIIAAI